MNQENFNHRDVADSMKAAASRLGVPLEIVKQCKQRGCRAFRGSRVYLRPLAEMIANGETETDTILFPVPRGPEAHPKTISEFRELLRVSIRCGWLTTQEILEIILYRIIEAWGSKLGSKEFGKAAETIHMGFGCAVMLLEPDSATDDFLKRSAAALER